MSDTRLPRPTARGYVTGQVVDFTDSYLCSFQVEGGAKIGGSMFGRQARKDALSENETGLWVVYPGTRENKLIFKIRGKAHSDKQEFEGQFFITGNIKKIKGEQIFVDIWSVVKHRYFLVIVEGHLKAKRGEYYELECGLDGDKLILVDGKKLADRLDPADYFAEVDLGSKQKLEAEQEQEREPEQERQPEQEKELATLVTD